MGGSEAVKDEKKSRGFATVSAGVPETEIDKMALVKFSMCRLEIKCN